MKKIMGILMAAVMMFGGVAMAAGFDSAREITVLSREDGSGTRGAFIELMGIEVKNADGEKVDMTTEEAVVTNSTAVMMTTVAGDKYAMGYVSLGSMNETVKALTIDGAEASVEAIKSGEYKVARPFNVAVTEDASDLAKDFLAYVLSAEGQSVIADNGYIALDDVQAFEGGDVSGKLVIGGSSSVTPVMEKLVEAYSAINANANIEVQQSDSTTGMNSALEGVCDIGMASRALKDSEIEAGLVGTTIAMDGIAVIVNLDNPADGLTAEQVGKIYMGEIVSWDELDA